MSDLKENFCRICLSLCDLQSLINLLEISELYKKTYQCLLEECTSYKLTLGNTDAENICNACANLIQNYYSFRLKVINSDESFRNGSIAIKEIKPECRDSADSCQPNPEEKDLTDNIQAIPDEKCVIDSYESLDESDVDSPVADELLASDFEVDKGPEIESKTELADEEAETHESDDTFKCEFCDELISSSNLFVYKLHLVTKHNKNEIRCKFCDKEFLTKGGLNKHKCPVIECPTCLDRFDTKKELYKHKKTHPDSNKLFCKYCQNSVNYSRAGLIVHLRGHTGEKPFLCSYCAKAFISKACLDIHLRIHTLTRRYKCNECDETFRHKNTFKNHKYKHLGIDPPKNYFCTICNRGFRRNGQRITHEEVHLTERKYECDICGNKYRTKICFATHKCELHKKVVEIFKCSLCPKEFTLKRYLLQHERTTHCTTKDFVCSICGKSFAIPRGLQRHMITHLDVTERPVKSKCKFCPKTFSETWKLNKHMVFHSDVRAFKCDFCEKMFKTKANATKHMKSVHVELWNVKQKQ